MRKQQEQKTLKAEKQLISEGHLSRLAKDYARMEANRAADIREKFLKALEGARENYQGQKVVEVADDGTMYSIKSFDEQIDEVISGKHNPRFDLYVSQTPQYLINLGFTNGALLMRNSKVNEILDKHSEMSIELLKKIPDAINNPILVLKSKTHPTESAVIITDIITLKGEMIIPVWVNQESNYVDVDLIEKNDNRNFVASAYGRNVKALIISAIDDNGVFFQSNKKRVNQLLARNGLQLSAPLKLSNSTVMISNSDNNVNSFSVKETENILNDNSETNSNEDIRYSVTDDFEEIGADDFEEIGADDFEEVGADDDYEEIDYNESLLKQNKVYAKLVREPERRISDLQLKISRGGIEHISDPAAVNKAQRESEEGSCKQIRTYG